MTRNIIRPHNTRVPFLLILVCMVYVTAPLLTFAHTPDIMALPTPYNRCGVTLKAKPNHIQKQLQLFKQHPKECTLTRVTSARYLLENDRLISENLTQGGGAYLDALWAISQTPNTQIAILTTQLRQILRQTLNNPQAQWNQKQIATHYFLTIFPVVAD